MVPADQSSVIEYAQIFTQSGPSGIQYDFNAGCQVTVPAGHWRIRLSDLDTGNVIYERTLSGGRIASRKQYFIRFRIDIWLDDAHVFMHEYCASGQQVLIRFPVNSLGDTIAWFASAAKFQQRHGCRLTCAMSPHIIPLFAAAYPEITFTDFAQDQAGPFYATYKPMLYFNDHEHLHQPYDYQLVGLYKTAAHILGVPTAEYRPRLAIEDTGRPIPERYVCIATQSTAQYKYWNNPTGWDETVDFLKRHGYRVICIDGNAVAGTDLHWNRIPKAAEDQTGFRPLAERAMWLRHADFFIGLSSGLSWLAWAVGVPVVLISGFTHPLNEFETPYRVINLHACNSCFNDVRLTYDRDDPFWCPRLAGTSQQYECSRLITFDQVRQAIERIPTFVEHT